MNTNKPTPVDELDLTGASQAISEGLPDPATLARLASEMYREFQQAPEASISGLTPPAMSAGTEPLTEVRLQQAASEISREISGEISGMSAPISPPPANVPSEQAERAERAERAEWA